MKTKHGTKAYKRHLRALKKIRKAREEAYRRKLKRTPWYKFKNFMSYAVGAFLLLLAIVMSCVLIYKIGYIIYLIIKYFITH